MLSDRLLPAPTLLLAALLWSTPIQGQDAPDLWRAQVELGFNGSSGNSSFGILRTGGSLRRVQTDRYELELSGLLRYGKSEERVIADELRGSAKFDWRPESVFSPFVFVTAGRDRIRKLDAKTNGGAGAKWTFLQPEGDRTKASFSLAGILDYENFALDAGSTEEETRSTVRLSGRFKFDHTLASGTTFGHVTFWQPEVSAFGDYNIEMSTTISTRLLSRLSLAIEHEYLHDSVPPPGTEPDDQKFSVVLRVAL